MKILITCLGDLTREEHGRPQEFIKYLCQNHELTVICTNAWWLEKQLGKKHSNYFESLASKVKFKYLSDHRISPLIQQILLRNLNNLLRDINYQTFDIHFNYHSLIPGYFVAKRLKHLGTPTVLDIADDLPEMIQGSLQVPYLLRPLGKLVARSILRKNIEVVTKITFIAKALQDSYHLPQSKSLLIPNGVDIELFHDYPSQQPRDELDIHQEFVIGFVGVLQGWVDLEPVFVAVGMMKEEHPNFKVLIVGAGDTLQQNKELVHKLGIADRVIFIGHVPYQQVPIYISGMNVCVLPFKTSKVAQNAVPLKLFEYMACEKPVISTPLAAVREAIGDRVFYAANAEEFRQRIFELYQNKELGTKLGKGGRAFVEKNYDWRKICRKFEKLLLEVAGDWQRFAG